MELISRKEAKKQGLTYYFTGLPCKKFGHISKRFVHSYSCYACGILHGKKYYYSHIPKILEKNKKWKDCNPLKVQIQQQKANSKRMPDIIARSKIWKKNNKEAVVRHTQKRRALKMNAPGEYTLLDIENLLALQDNSCAACNVSFLNCRSTIDHIIPLSKNGSNWPDNIQLLCLSCNSSKGAKTAAEWEEYKKIARDTI